MFMRLLDLVREAREALVQKRVYARMERHGLSATVLVWELDKDKKLQPVGEATVDAQVVCTKKEIETVAKLILFEKNIRDYKIEVF